MKQDTTQATPFELIYSRTATLPVEIESGKFDHKWDEPFHIEEILGNGTYKLRLDNKILTKAAHEDQLKPYHNITLLSTSNIPQLGVQKILVQPKEISQDLEPIIIIDNNMLN
ncbi:hypothetical protein G9A89_006844 [Geosiphon pyriformis]|nr:hypothetical protein G9A89_006844 [Geosiphon pyriformis]